MSKIIMDLEDPKKVFYTIWIKGGSFAGFIFKSSFIVFF